MSIFAAASLQAYRVSDISYVQPGLDQILANASTCVPSIIPTGTLPGAYVQFNNFESPGLAVNNKDHDNIIVWLFRDASTSSITIPLGLDSVLGVSKDGGKSWAHVAPTANYCLDPQSPSQSLAILNVSFSENGRAFLISNYNQTNPIGTSTTVDSGFYSQYSDDGGLTWSKPFILSNYVNQSGTFLPGANPSLCSGVGCFAANGLGAILADPKHCNPVTAVGTTIDINTFFFGGAVYWQSHDGGKSFGPQKLLYDLSQDPAFTSQTTNPNNPPYHNPNFSTPYYAGEVYCNTIVAVPCGKKSDVLLTAIFRSYPRQTNFCTTDAVTFTTPGGIPTTNWTQLAQDSYYDHVVLQSFDKGATWSTEPIVLPQFTWAPSHDPRSACSPCSETPPIIIFDGSLFTYLAVSPKTNRVYCVYQGTHYSTDVAKNVAAQCFPEILLNVSDDAGKKWSRNVRVSKTQDSTQCHPKNPGCQSFNPNIAILADGTVAIAYNDFRFYKTTPDHKHYVPCDAWLAIYRETDDPKGGSTGVGLDFVEEIRLTSQSFNAVIGFTSPVDNSAAGSIIGLGATKCHFLTSVGYTYQGGYASPGGPNNSLPLATVHGATYDYNNRFNAFFAKVTP